VGPRGDQYFAALQRGPPCAPSSENRPPAHLNLHVDVTHTHTHAHAHTDHSPRPCPAVSLERHVVASRRPDWVDRGAVVRPPPCHRLQLPRSLHALRRRVQLQLASPVARWHDPKGFSRGLTHVPARSAPGCGSCARPQWFSGPSSPSGSGESAAICHCHPHRTFVGKNLCKKRNHSCERAIGTSLITCRA
jgi:hypothetical protein